MSAAETDLILNVTVLKLTIPDLLSWTSDVAERDKVYYTDHYN